MCHKKSPEYGLIIKKGQPASFVLTPEQEERVKQMADDFLIKSIPWMITNSVEKVRQEAEAARIKSLEPPKTLAQKLSDLIKPRKSLSG